MPTASPIGVASAVAWGDVPTWVGAIATTLGLVAAGLAAWFVRGQLKQMKIDANENREEIKRQRTEFAQVEASRARAQAEQIEVAARSRNAVLRDNNLTFFPTVTVKNTSNRPIRNLRVKASPTNGDAPTHSVGEFIGRIELVNGDTRFVADHSLGSPFALLARDASVAFLLPIDAGEFPHTKFWVQFEDDAGLWWHLDSGMHLQQIHATERWGY